MSSFCCHFRLCIFFLALSDVLLFLFCMAQELVLTLLPLFCLQLSSVWTTNDSSYISSSLSSDTGAYCSFFSNRAPSPQPALTNCTWFTKNSCCRDNEVRLIFSQVGLNLNEISIECFFFLSSGTSINWFFI